MGTVLRTWIFALTGAAVLGTLCKSISDNTRLKRVVALCCGMVTLIALVSPVMDIDAGTLLGDIFNQNHDMAQLDPDIEKNNDALRRGYIEDKCSAYILDKAASLGVENLTVTVTAKWSSDGYWYPIKAVIGGKVEPSVKKTLAFIMASELGIAEDEQIWSGEDEN